MKSDTPSIRIRGARQNNLRNINLDIPTGELVVFTGVSGSGKSSLVFDTLYAEGQRRYVETFSAYARQFLDRMDKPQVDAIEGVPPAIAIDQTNPVRTSRSTVGTMTELNDHLKLLFARCGNLHCRKCQQQVMKDSPASALNWMQAQAVSQPEARLFLCFPAAIPENFGQTEVEQYLQAQGFTRVHQRLGNILYVLQDRFKASAMDPQRALDSLESAFRFGHGKVSVFVEQENATAQQRAFSNQLHCAACDLFYSEPTPSQFSFNSPLGACETCRGFGRVIGVDLGLVIPDENKTLRGGAVKPWQTPSFKECHDDMVRHGARLGLDLDTPFKDLAEKDLRLLVDGEPAYKSWQKSWYGITRYFNWLESRAYKMHVRVMLSKYRAYTPCKTCNGSRLKPDGLLWRIANAQSSYNVHEMMLQPISTLQQFFASLKFQGNLDEASDLLLTEVRSRLSFLMNVGLGYLTLDRQSRTLSGGEVQRINLTTALGTSLVNTLFVLDEPSIGLHPRDMQRVVGVMQRLRDAGNSLVVVEHDPQIMFAADRIIDIGPGPGERGGNIVFNGTPATLRAADTLTGNYLSGRLRVTPNLQRLPVDGDTPRLSLQGANLHNVRQLSVDIPLGRMVGVTGVSGSGKSTLIQDLLLPALQKHFGKPTEMNGSITGLLGAHHISDCAMVDQSPIGRTARSNPASYVGVFEVIRERFARLPAARERGWKASKFSFNAGDGRCPTCGGNGFEHVEMQFLSDVYLRCQDCDGKRFRPEVLELKLEGWATAEGEPLAGTKRSASIADVLDMTVSQALVFFARDVEMEKRLRPLADVGLEYVRLGQPVPTLSGGEAQRLKLAGFLADEASAPALKNKLALKGKLFLFDEPTTGLHFDDIAKLLKALRQLVNLGHSLVIIEHNLDLIDACDWLLELGPEGGDAGGQLVAQGTPDALSLLSHIPTGKALHEYREQLAGRLSAQEPRATYQANALDDSASLQSVLRARARNAILVHKAREHNLKNIDVEIPRQQFTVITGPSGSGKSTLAFDIIFGEGQRRYLESLNAYARQYVQPSSRPDVDGVFGIPPAVAIEQRTSRGGRKSTVATLTEIYHFLRLLYVKLGTQYCPTCKVVIDAQSFDSILARLMKDYRGQRLGLLAPLVVARKGIYTDLAKWANGKGFTHLRVDGDFLPTAKFPRIDRYTEHSIELPVADVLISPETETEVRAALHSALEYGKGVVMTLSDLPRLEAAIKTGETKAASLQLPTRLFSVKRACSSCGTSYPELDPRQFSFNSKHGWCTSCFGTGQKLLAEQPPEIGEGRDKDRGWVEQGEWGDLSDETCEPCQGQRLNPVALNVQFANESIAQLTAHPIDELAKRIATLNLDGRSAEIARDVVSEIGARLRFLSDVGLGYLTLNRSAPTLSGGEAQRIRLASQLGSNLQGVCYVLDEPTIGLHPRDNRRLISTLRSLQQKGNTLIVVEHDEETIRQADHLVDIGPGAGVRGGTIVAQGSVKEVLKNKNSLTARLLAHPLVHPQQARRPVAKDTPAITLKNARLHNIAGIDVRLPLGRLNVITGVSGSGKSTLARDIFLHNLHAIVSARNLGRASRDQAVAALKWHGCDALEGSEPIARVLEVDQTPIGKTPRSCPATYIGFWDTIRRVFADTVDARVRGYEPSRFSFNTGAGRCEGCEGQGWRTIEMNFLPDVKVLCDQCKGQRFNRATLEVQLRGKSIGDVLTMSVDDAVEYFGAHAGIRHSLKLLQDVGLGYLTLGQPSPTLSGGEAQRIKLVTELSKVRSDLAEGRKLAKINDHTVYVLDEPTVGLHMSDVDRLIKVLHRLVDAGNTVVVVEHDVDIWLEADWIIDMGPEGGDGGGKLSGAGTPETLAKGNSHTAKVLAQTMAARA
jgi:excinuclease ABC subunit A